MTITEILVLVSAVLEALVLRYIKFLGYQIFPCGNTEALQGQRIDSYHSVSSNCDQDKSICNNPFALSDDQHIKPTNNWLHMMVYICTTTPSLNFKNLNFMHFLLSVAMIFISARKFHCIQARDEDDFIVDYIMEQLHSLAGEITNCPEQTGSMVTMVHFPFEPLHSGPQHTV